MIKFDEVDAAMTAAAAAAPDRAGRAHTRHLLLDALNCRMKGMIFLTLFSGNSLFDVQV